MPSSALPDGLGTKEDSMTSSTTMHGLTYPYAVSAIRYDNAQVREATLAYYGGNTISTDTWMKKYALRDEQERFVELTPEHTQQRLAREFARIEQKYPNPMSYEEILGLMTDWKYVIPQGSPMSAIGNPFMVQSLSNCFVVDDVQDSYGGICHSDQELAQIMKRRGGGGVDVSHIRPKEARVANAARTTAGLGPYLERFSNTTREVGQDGRRGALMLTCSCRHPEVMTFINIKKDKTKVTGANMSIRWTDDFMQAVKANEEYTLRWPCNVPLEEAKITQKVQARDIWLAFIEAAHDCAEPGALFWDTILRESVADAYADEGFRTVSTNPCGEIPLSAYDACRLMVMNLMGFVTAPYSANATFDWPLFSSLIGYAQRLMDDLVDLEIEAIDRILQKIKNDPEPAHIKQVEIALWTKIRDSNVKGRRTGLGITALGDTMAALGDTMAALGLKYGSPESVEFTTKVYRALAVATESSSIGLARERGHFPVWDLEKEAANPYLQRVLAAIEDPSLLQDYAKFGRRNISTTTTAPVGTTSFQALVAEVGGQRFFGTTSGCEPVAVSLSSVRYRKMDENDFAQGVSIDRTDALGDRWHAYTVHHPGLQAWMKVTGESDITKSPYWGATSREIDWEASVDIQAAAQKWISHSISKTCNLPADTSVDLVDRCYMRAWETGCKGFTVYREGSRMGVIVDKTDKAKIEEQARASTAIIETHAPKRPESLVCDVHHTRIKGQSWVVLVGMLNGKPYEVFAGEAERIHLPRKHTQGQLIKQPKRGGSALYDLVLGAGDEEIIVKDVVHTFDNPEHGAFTRALSLSLRHGVPVQYLVEQLGRDKSSDFTRFSAVLARVLKKYIADGTKATSEKACGSCGASPLTYVEGCMTCSACGWSKCG